MYKKFSLIFILAICLITLLSAVTDDDWIANLLARLEKLRTDYPQEKVHLQLDKPYYSIGDDIWFKAYVVSTENHELSALSKVLYVELVDGQDSLRKTVVLPIANGLSNGDIKLTDSLVNAGVYHIRAYTRWMQNFSSDYIFDKEIIIGDARTPTSVAANASFAFEEQNKLNAKVTYQNLTDKTPYAGKPVIYTLLYQGKSIASGNAVTDNSGSISFVKNLKDEYKKSGVYLQTTINVTPNNPVERNSSVYNPKGETDVQFFPEGGRLVNGLRSKVAFKATLANGNSADIKGRIVDQSNKDIADIQSVHAGMGVFALLPVAGNKYTAILTDNFGTENRYNLPVADNEGYVLGVNHTGSDSITVRITASTSLITGKEVALIALQNGVVRYTTKIKLDQPSISTKIGEKRFVTGIVQFTLLSSEALPLAERLLFVNHHDQLKLNIITGKAAYAKREKVDLQFKASGDDGQAIQGNFSVVVTDENKVKIDEDAENTIYSDLLLTSDLKGRIENPNYYFNNESDEKVRHLDYLLLTQGWRRFNWTDLKENKLPALIYNAQKSIGVIGKIATHGGKPVPYGKVTLFASTPQGPVLVDTTADANGNFVINDLDFTGDVKAVVKAQNAKSKDNVDITLIVPPRPVYNSLYAKPNDNLSEAITNYLINTQKRFDAMDNGLLNKMIMLNEVKVTESRSSKKFVVDGSAKLGIGPADIVVKNENLTRYTSLIQAFYGMAGISVQGNKIFRVGRGASFGGNRPMLIQVNGMAFAPEMLSAIAPADVEGIEILKSNYNLAVYGDAGSSGVIEITLKKGSSVGGRLNLTSVGRQIVKGYSVQREFYSPEYDKADKRHAEADVRSTIYWNPNFVTDAEGKATLSCFTADQPGTYRVVAEGIDIDGRLARQVYRFTVK